VVVRRTGYPQVDPRAAGLMHRGLVTLLARATVGEAAALARRRGAVAVAGPLGAGWGVATRQTLDRALALGLAAAPVDTVLWEAPVVPPAAPEVAVRRRLGPAVPALLVGDARGLRGVVLAEPAARRVLPLDVSDRLARLPAAVGDWLARAGAAADALGVRVGLVGGLVRDLLLERGLARTDLDLVVEGSARDLARRLAGTWGGRVVEHPAFLTATLEAPDGRRVDLATARRERYPAPGALPDVEPASLDEDLARRDFSVNALAVRLDGGAPGALADPTGGLADLRARRLRVLHPLSFVEDPTRIFRAARFAARLGFRIDRTTRRLAVGAARLGVHRALSGDRLRAELELILAEPDPAAALLEAARLGGWRLIGPEAPVGPREARLVARVLAPPALSGLAPGTALAVALLALAGGTEAAETAAARLALGPALRDAIRRARLDAPPLLRDLRAVGGPSAAYTRLRSVPEATLVWARALAGAPAARRYLDLRLGPWRGLRPLAGGDDLAALGVPAGPEVGALLGELLAAQAAGRVRSRAAARRWLERAAARRRAAPRAPLTEPAERGG
jgi:tRNA nucleotidyltransferase (CCA-adding enzyme)